MVSQELWNLRRQRPLGLSNDRSGRPRDCYSNLAGIALDVSGLRAECGRLPHR